MEWLHYLGPVVSVAGILITAPRWAFRIEAAVDHLRDAVDLLSTSDAAAKRDHAAIAERLARIEERLSDRLATMGELEERIRALEQESRSARH